MSGESWLLEGRRGCLHQTSGIAACERGREDAACLRGEVGCQSWGAEVKVLLWCSDAIIPSHPGEF